MIRNLSVQVWIVATVTCSSQTLLGAELSLLGKLRPTDTLSDAMAVSEDGKTVVGVSFMARSLSQNYSKVRESILMVFT
jgi:hypothetical protein